MIWKEQLDLLMAMELQKGEYQEKQTPKPVPPPAVYPPYVPPPAFVK